MVFVSLSTKDLDDRQIDWYRKCYDAMWIDDGCLHPLSTYDKLICSSNRNSSRDSRTNPWSIVTKNCLSLSIGYKIEITDDKIAFSRLTILFQNRGMRSDDELNSHSPGDHTSSRPVIPTFLKVYKLTLCTEISSCIHTNLCCNY